MTYVKIVCIANTSVGAISDLITKERNLFKVREYT